MSDQPSAVPVVKTGIRKVITRALERELTSANRKLLNVQRKILSRSPNAGFTLEAVSPSVPKQASRLCAEFLAAKVCKPRTADSLRHLLKTFMQWAGDRLLTRELLEQWVVYVSSREDWKPSYKNLMAKPPLSVARWAHATGRLSVNLATGIKPPKCPPQQPRDTWSPEEFEQLLEYANSKESTKHIGVLLTIGWETGMSFSDCCLLEWGHVDLERCIIRKRRVKTDTEAVIPFVFDSRMHKLLLELHADAMLRYKSVTPSTPVCAKAYIDRHATTKALYRMLNSCGIRKGRTFHSFRSTFISDCANKGVSTPMAMKMTGLKSPSVFSLYATIDEKALREQRSIIR